MPISEPTLIRDKTEDWMQVFRAKRVAALAPLVTPALVAEHCDNPRGPHSHDLQLVLNYVRGPAYAMDRKPFVYMRKPYSEYGIALMTARGEPVEFVEDQLFATEIEAVHAVFLQRLAAHGLDRQLPTEAKYV